MNYNIDLQSIADELDFDLEDVEMLMEVFLETSTEQIALLEQAVNNNNLEEIGSIAHSIKGSSANLTLIEISDLAKEIELDAKEKKDINYKNKINLLKELIQKI